VFGRTDLADTINADIVLEGQRRQHFNAEAIADEILTGDGRAGIGINPCAGQPPKPKCSGIQIPGIGFWVHHVDAHADINDEMFGEKIAHGTTFRRAVEEGLLDCARVVQIGLRSSGYAPDDFDWARDQGFRVVQVEECWHKSLVPLMDEVREQVGKGPVYLSFDIDGIDPAFAPGTGTPEIGGLTTIQGMEIVRGCQGLNLIGSDLMEVSPPYDTTGSTSLLAANLLYEMLCVLPGVKHQ